MTQRNIFSLCRIAYDYDDKMYWVYYAGEVVNQGGPSWGMANSGFKELENALAFINNAVEKNMDKYLEIMEEKVNDTVTT